MNKKFIFIIMTFLISMSFGTVFASDDLSQLSVDAIFNTDLNQIEITGTTSGRKNISVRVNYPNGEICYINQIKSTAAGEFAASCDVAIPYNGYYKITVSTTENVYDGGINIDVFKKLEISEPEYVSAAQKNTVYDIYDYHDISIFSNVVNNGEKTATINMYNVLYGSNKFNMKYASKSTAVIPAAEQGTLSGKMVLNDLKAGDMFRTCMWDNNMEPYTTAKDMHISADKYFTDVSPLYKCFAKGVLNGESGTIQMKLKINKPIDYFGSDYDYIFEVNSAKTFSTNIKTLFGLIITPATEKTVYVPLRTENTNYWLYVDWKDFVYTPGEEFTLSVSWENGGEIAMYINGRKLPARYGSQNVLGNGIEDSLIPYDMTFFDGNIFDISNIKISSAVLDEERLLEDAADEFLQDEDTVMLYDKNLGETKYYTSSYHFDTAYSSCIPAWREDTQCLTFDENINYPLAVVNHGTEARDYSISISIFDMDGNYKGKAEGKLTAEADGKYHIYNMKLPVFDNPGLYCLETTICGGGKTEIYNSRISILPANNKSIPDGALSDSYGNVVPPEHGAEYISKLNARYTRDFNIFSWQLVEPEKGNFYWDKTDSYVKRCKDNGIECIGLLNKVPGWAGKTPEYDEYNPRVTSFPPRDMDEWYNYVYQTVLRYKDDVIYWEVMNEVNYHPPYSTSGTSCTPEQYKEILATAYRAAKDANPGCYVLVAGFAAPFGELDKQMPYDYTTAEYAQGYYDIYNIHGYNGTQIWEDVLDNLKKTQPDIPVWMTEYYPIAYTDADDMAFFNVKTYVSFISVGCEKFINMGAYGSETYTSYAERSPTKCYQATGTLQSIIRKCDSYISKVNVENGDNLTLKDKFRRTDGKFVYVIGSEMLSNAEIYVKGKVIAAEDMYGKTLNPIISDERYCIPVEHNIVYIITDGDADFYLANEQYVNLIVNGGFENTIGETVTDWIFSVNDGSIALSCPDNENHMISITADASNDLFILQNKTLTSNLRCRISATIKNYSNETVSVFLGYNNRELYFEGKPSVTEKTFDILSNSTEKISYTVDIPKTDKMPHGIMVGTKKGNGKVYIDDVKLEIIGK